MPNNFLDDLDSRYIDGKRWLITARFRYRLGSPDGDEFVQVNAGEIINFASIPRPLKLVWPSPGGPWDKPSAVHDSLYVHPYVQHRNGSRRRIERDEADRIFSEGMEVTGTNGLTRRLLYAGVRSGGWVAWSRYRAAETKQLAEAQAARWWIGDPWMTGVPS